MQAAPRRVLCVSQAPAPTPHRRCSFGTSSLHRNFARPSSRQARVPGAGFRGLAAPRTLPAPAPRGAADPAAPLRGVKHPGRSARHNRSLSPPGGSNSVLPAGLEPKPARGACLPMPPALRAPPGPVSFPLLEPRPRSVCVGGEGGTEVAEGAQAAAGGAGPARWVFVLLGSRARGRGSTLSMRNFLFARLCWQSFLSCP